MKQLVLATRNADKVKEFQSLLHELPIELLSLDAFPGLGNVVEDEDTLQGNARKKAREVFRFTNLPTLADDSGLEVHYLNKRPGVFSSRYAGAHATYAENCRKVLEEMKGVPPRRRAARFRCVLAFEAPLNREKLAEGICTGVIVETPRGNHGFGYDPIFLPDGCDQTFAELEPVLKNQLSHRSKAVHNIEAALADCFR